MLHAKFTKFAVKYLPLFMVEAIAAVLLSIVEVRGNDIVGGVIDIMLSGEAVDFSPFFIHINCVQMFTLLEEIIMHNINAEETKQIFLEYIHYHNFGWKELIYNDNE